MREDIKGIVSLVLTQGFFILEVDKGIKIHGNKHVKYMTGKRKIQDSEHVKYMAVNL